MEYQSVVLHQQEKTLEQGDKRKGPTSKPISSMQYLSPMGTTPTWLKRGVLIRKRRIMEFTEEEGMKELIRVVNML